MPFINKQFSLGANLRLSPKWKHFQNRPTLLKVINEYRVASFFMDHGDISTKIT